jgi:signal transduction histidine kinase
MSYYVFGAMIIYVLSCFAIKVRKINIGQGIFIGGLVFFLFSAVMDVFYFTFDDLLISPPFQLTGVAMLLFALCKATAVFLDTMREVAEAKQAEQRLEIAEESNKAKGVFLAKMSHEIRTPMNAIIGMSELILRENLSSSAHDQAVTIKHSGDHLLSIINDILDFSKIESGKLEIINNRYLFHSTINDVVNIIKMRMTNADLKFVVYVQHDIPNELFGDVVRLRQVLLNILTNSLKYTKAGYF